MRRQGSIFGGMLLITGSCVGAGMLGLPILTGMAGFFPSLIMFFAAWLFMTITALYLVEVNGWFHTPVNLLSMVRRTLGETGAYFSWALYLFLFYALLVAYLSTSGNHVTEFFRVPQWLGMLIFVLFFGWIVYLGTRSVDLVNRWLMAGKIAVYIFLIGIGLQAVDWPRLAYQKMGYAFFSLPLLIVSFGFHNMIPSLSAYLGGDVVRVKKAIFLGSLLTLVIYLLWEIIALGILPLDWIFKGYRQDQDAAQTISVFLKNDFIGVFAQLLAFFAILTSFLAQTLSLVHFIADGVKAKKREHPWLCALALFPPLLFSLFFPQLFFKALSFAGGFCAVILFGIFPALMVWIGRYRHKIPATYRLTGGQPLLVLILLSALFILIYQFSSMIGLPFLPVPPVSSVGP